MLLLQRSGGRCEICGESLQHDLKGKIERHHRRRRRDGGDRLSNLLLAHSSCHTFVTTHPEWARERGMIVLALSTLDVADVPVQHPTLGLVLLDDDGGWTLAA